MVNRVPSKPTRVRPAVVIAAAVGSAMWMKGTSTTASIAGATSCIVLVAKMMSSAPAA